MSFALTHGQTYEMVLRVESLPLTMTDDHIVNVLDDTGFSGVALWHVGDATPPYLAEAFRDGAYAVFPAWLTYAKGQWDGPTREQSDDLGEASILRMRALSAVPTAPPRSRLFWPIAASATAGLFILAGLVGLQLEMRNARRR